MLPLSIKMSLVMLSRCACKKHLTSNSSTLLTLHSGIPYRVQNQTAQPWTHLETTSYYNYRLNAACPVLVPSYPSKYWHETITHNGQSSFMDSRYKSDYKVFRNVVADFKADNTGRTDASAAIQKAIAGEPFNLIISAVLIF
jgi:polygalacturonase